MRNLSSSLGKDSSVKRLVTLAVVCALTGLYLNAQTSETSPDPRLRMEHAYSTSGLILEYERAICVLERGIQKQWATREQYLSAFQMTNDKGPAGEILEAEKKSVSRLLGAWLPRAQNGIWDEQLPYYIVVEQRIIFFKNTRDTLLLKDQAEGDVMPGSQ